MTKIHAKYLKAAEETLSSVRCEKNLTADEGLFTAKRDGVTLSFLVENEVVADAGFQGAEDAEKAILERLCRMAVGRPMQEVAEHGLIYVEFEMRDPNVASPVSGLLTPKNADPAFERPSQLVRECYLSFTLALGITEPERNFWSPRAGEAWAKSDTDKKRQQLEKTIAAVASEKRWFDLRFEVVGIADTKVTVSFQSNAMSGADIGHAIMVLENELKLRLEPQLELALEDIEDRNKRLDRTQISRHAEVKSEKSL